MQLRQFIDGTVLVTLWYDRVKHGQPFAWLITVYTDETGNVEQENEYETWEEAKLAWQELIHELCPHANGPDGPAEPV